MIKKVLYILLLALMVVPFANTLVSCGGGDDGGDEGPQLTVSPPSVNLKGTEEVKINVTSNVTWSVSVDASWLHVITTGGTRNGSFTIYADDNTSTNSRSTRVHVKAERANVETTVVVTQDPGNTPANPTLTVNATSMDFAYSGGSNSFSVSSNISWTVSSDKSWCTVSPASGSNNGTVTITVLENTTSEDRNATITVSGNGLTKTIVVSQGHKDPDPYLNIDKTNMSFSSSSGSDTFSISSNVSWTVTSSDSWCTVDPTSGSNNGTITVKVAENSSASSRSATITISGGSITRTITVNQTQNYTLTVSPSSLSFNADGETKSITVTSNDSWTVSSNQSWCTLSVTSGSNNGTVKVTASKNTTSSSRSAKITFKGSKSGITKEVSVTQDAPVDDTVDVNRGNYGNDVNLNNK